MRQSLARYSATVSFVHAPSLADFITTIVGFEVFGTHNATDSSCANRVRLSVLGRRVHSAYGSEYANSRDAIGRRHRVAKDPEPTLPDDRGRSDVSFGESL